MGEEEAGGFINKKFFHPSTLRNQEKLWKAQTEDEREFRKQQELQKRRDEERQASEKKGGSAGEKATS